jgi:Reverse transcriptase (RNA-dependent DNA polymerase)
MGTPQGGVISPLLANIGLHGLENYIKSTNPKLGVVRYADDFVVTARDRGSLEIVQDQSKKWLSTRGLQLSAKKTTKWTRKRYFKTINGNKWTFATTTSDRQGDSKVFYLYQIAYTSIERHVKVKGNASPDDPY